ncbi:type II toxin-antitoxin system VapC family toxin [Candidatus Poribacteria bacterium]|nr:type II toxin-antitoxin system VapC family toxin [Candidatus Poribacteria bacterium]
MPGPSVYIETSVVSYLVARPSRDIIMCGHQILTQEWWERALPKVQGFVSPAVIDEIRRGDPLAAQRRLSAVQPLAILPFTQEVSRMAGIYLRELLIPESEPYDTLHLAYASVHAVDYLITWNCRHLASALVQRRIGAINKREGYPYPGICLPEELMEV